MTGGNFERVDDYCATSYIYCREAQPVPRLDLAAAIADIGRRPWEQPSPFEAMFAAPREEEDGQQGNTETRRTEG